MDFIDIRVPGCALALVVHRYNEGAGSRMRGPWNTAAAGREGEVHRHREHLETLDPVP